MPNSRKTAEKSEAKSPRRSPMNMKTSPELRAMIEGAATFSGLSMSQEVERRLIDSFKQEAENEATRSLLGLIRASITHLETMSGRTFSEDPATHAAVSDAVARILERFEPFPANLPTIAAQGEALKHIEASYGEAVRYLEGLGVWAEPVNALADTLAARYAASPQTADEYPFEPIISADSPRRTGLFGGQPAPRYKTVLPQRIERTTEGEPRQPEEIELIRQAIDILKERSRELRAKRSEYLAEWGKHDDELARGKEMAKSILPADERP